MVLKLEANGNVEFLNKAPCLPGEAHYARTTMFEVPN